MKTQRLKPWNITQLAYELHKDLAQCSNAFERSNARAMTTVQIRQLRDEINGKRRFTPGEIAVMDELGVSWEAWEKHI